MRKQIYVCHEYYTPSHYTALEYLANEHGYEVVYCEPNLYFELRRSFKNSFNRSRLAHNICCMFTLLFSKGNKVVIGMAPYNPFLKWLLFILRGHELYYHSSYSCWDGSRFAYKGSPQDIKLWKDFTYNKIKCFFAVSEKTKNEVVKNGFSNAYKISVVNHSFNINIDTDGLCRFSKTFLCVGRLVKEKGIAQLLYIFSLHPEASISFVGKGEMEGLVKEYADKYTNIKYLGFIKGLQNLVPIYKAHSFLVLNSIKTPIWEELFGMALYEGMACGCVPLANRHSGPKEIITDGVDGFLCEENHIDELIEVALNMDEDSYNMVRTKAIERGQSFKSSVVAKKWNHIFEV